MSVVESGDVLVSDDPLALAAALPDAPCWVETRALLRSGAGALTVAPGGDGAVLLDPGFPSGFVIGRADATLLAELLTAVADDFELVVQLDALEDVRAALPSWNVALATIHSPARPWGAGAVPAPGVVVCAPPAPALLAGLPEDITRYASVADAAAVRVIDRAIVAVCAAGDVTETLWDVGVDTLEPYRRKGHAEACFRALATHMAAEGRQPVWGAEDDNAASMRLAAKLGFEPVDRLAVLSPPA